MLPELVLSSLPKKKPLRLGWALAEEPPFSTRTDTSLSVVVKASSPWSPQQVRSRQARAGHWRKDTKSRAPSSSGTHLTTAESMTCQLQSTEKQLQNAPPPCRA